MKRSAALLSLLFAMTATGTGIAVGVATLALPSHVRCQLPPLESGVGQTIANNCTPISVIESGAEVWPLPLLAIMLWSVAPALAVIGAIRLLHHQTGLSLVGLAVVLEASAIVSFVAGPLFLLWVFSPLVACMTFAVLSALLTMDFAVHSSGDNAEES